MKLKPDKSPDKRAGTRENQHTPMKLATISTAQKDIKTTKTNTVTAATKAIKTITIKRKAPVFMSAASSKTKTLS